MLGTPNTSKISRTTFISTALSQSTPLPPCTAVRLLTVTSAHNSVSSLQTCRLFPTGASSSHALPQSISLTHAHWYQLSLNTSPETASSRISSRFGEEGRAKYSFTARFQTDYQLHLDRKVQMMRASLCGSKPRTW